MTLDQYRSLADRTLEPFVEGADRAGMTPNGVSVLAFAVAGFAAGAFYVAGANPGWYLVGALLVLLNGALDLLDGALARRQNVASTAGDLLDHVLDRYADILIIAGLAAGIGEYAVGFLAVTGVLMTSYLGTQAQAVGLDRVYGGMLGRADRLVLVGVVAVLTALYPAAILGLTLVGWLLVLFAVVGHITALQRFYHAMGALG
ncbi:CDP-alcohol phosphatidyltransferase family protein [Halalkalicoccus tibetensis]|uniref:CDP-alcohol phosphatidyltransferase family protein n=1 Tax=Halalkalicoccus tibetensis TaxID=175632 RepID=A0ABD5UZB8_9EURY